MFITAVFAADLSTFDLFLFTVMPLNRLHLADSTRDGVSKQAVLSKFTFTFVTLLLCIFIILTSAYFLALDP